MLKGELEIDGLFEWWSDKNEANIKKHHYSFKEVEKIFNDPYFFMKFMILSIQMRSKLDILVLELLRKNALCYK
ncbi:MAG: BrnT family toxin [Treponema succinifaciens]|nr:MAG: BrnT family toxin [Treponema succinifaciens]